MGDSMDHKQWTGKYHGRYAPRRNQLLSLQHAFCGARQDDDFYAPPLMPNEAFIKALQHLFDSSATILQAANLDIESGLLLKATELAESRSVRLVVDELASAKTHLMNHYALCKKLANDLIDNQPASIYQQEAFRFVLELLEQNHNTRNFLIRYFEFSKEEVQLFETFIGQTVMALFAMGYPDAAHHSSQVARLCVVKASKNGANRAELLQSIMVGWLHDPKLLNTLSIDNLSTHPVIGSAIAYSVLRQKSTFEKLTAYLKPSGLKPLSFIRGVTDALSVNNDSRFVAERFIYDQVSMQIVRHHGKELGNTLTKELKETHQQRLSAPSNEEIPWAFSENLEIAISDTTMDSGFVGLKKQAWLNACIQANLINGCHQQQADSLYREAVTGQFKDKSKLKEIVQYLLHYNQNSESATVKWPINGKYLFSHHDEVSVHGKQAALALVCSDPLMLSPHKILEVRPNEEPLIQRLKSYIFSLKSNINDLPKFSQSSAFTWQRSIYLCLLKAAKKLVGGQQLHEFYQNHQSTDITEDLRTLEAMVLDEKTWKDCAQLTNSDDDEIRFTQLLHLLQAEYLEMCQYYRDAVLSEDTNEAKIF